MAEQRVLITGGAGFLGSHLCDRFVAEGYEVLCMDNLITGDLRNIEHLFGHARFHFFHQDVTEYIHVPGRLDVIMHFASPASARSTPSVLRKPRERASSSPPPPRSMAIPWSIRSGRTTGET